MTPAAYLAHALPTHAQYRLAIAKLREYSRRVHNLPIGPIELYGTIRLLEILSMTYHGGDVLLDDTGADRGRLFLRSPAASESVCSDLAILSVAAWRCKRRDMRIDLDTGTRQARAFQLARSSFKAMIGWLREAQASSILGPSTHDRSGRLGSCSRCSDHHRLFTATMEHLNPELADADMPYWSLAPLPPLFRAALRKNRQRRSSPGLELPRGAAN